MEKTVFYSTLGEDSHEIVESTEKPLFLAGIMFSEADIHLRANSDGDVVLHAITRAISSATGVQVLGKTADNMCRAGIIKSSRYLKVALETLRATQKIIFVSISIEAKRPKFAPRIEKMRASIANLLEISSAQVGITASTGEGLTEFGKGNGIFVKALVSFSEEI